MSTDRKASSSEAESSSLRQTLAFLHQARNDRALQPAEVERIARRLKGRKYRPRRVMLGPALATLGLVLVVGTTFAVAKGGLRSLPIVGPLFMPASPTGETRPEKRRRPATAKPATENAPAAKAGSETTPASTIEPARTLVPEVAQTSKPAARPARLGGPHLRNLALRDPGYSREGERTTRTPESSAPLAASHNDENPIVAESRSFASVIEPWHRTHDPNATLALLDAHERRYPSGHMRLESRVLRAEIYLAQGRETAALSVLDSLSLSGIPRARELQTVRGELRIKAGRCAEGKRDLGDVLEKSVADHLARRAAQAISHCP